VTHADRFLGLYEQLDEAMRNRLRADRAVSHARLIEMMAEADPTFRDNASRLQAYRALRNALVHHPRFGRPEAIADPRPDVVEDYARMVAYVLRPPTALEAIAVRKIYTVRWQTPLLEALRYLLPRSFRLAPILADGSLDGVFTETTLAQLAAERGNLHLTEESTFEDLRCVASLDVPTPGVRFLPAAASVVDAEYAFAEAFRAHVVLSALLITEGHAAACPAPGDDHRPRLAERAAAEVSRRARGPELSPQRPAASLPAGPGFARRPAGSNKRLQLDWPAVPVSTKAAFAPAGPAAELGVRAPEPSAVGGWRLVSQLRRKGR
jgi:hypothetical protein